MGLETELTADAALQRMRGSGPGVSDAEGPLVSIGLATYDRPEQLRDALDCIVKQTYRNLEIIVSEDCSPNPETNRVIEHFVSTDPRVRAIHHSTNIGAAENIHLVLTEAKGEYFTWADDDDLRDERWIEALLDKLNSNENAIVALSNVVAIDEDRKPLQYCRPLEFSGARPIRLARYFLADESGGKACIVCGLFKTGFLKTIRPFEGDEPGKYGDDYRFVMDCLQAGDAVVDQSVTLYKRMPVGGKGGKSRFTLSLITGRLRYFVNCALLPPRLIDRLTLMPLVPLKLFRSVYGAIAGRLFARS